MKKNFKKGISLVLIASFVSSMFAFSTFASTEEVQLPEDVVLVNEEVSIDNVIELAKEANPSITATINDVIVETDDYGNEVYIVPVSTEKADVKETTILDIYEILKDDPIVDMLDINGNVLKYSFDGIDVTITESVDELGTISWIINEDDTIDNIVQDIKNQIVTYNGFSDETYITEAMVFQNNISPMAEGWVHYKTYYADWNNPTGDAILTLSANSLFLGVTTALGKLMMPKLAFSISAAQIIINFAYSISSKSPALYSITNMFHSTTQTRDSVFQAWYLDSRHTQHAHTEQWYQ